MYQQVLFFLLFGRGVFPFRVSKEVSRSEVNFLLFICQPAPELELVFAFLVLERVKRQIPGEVPFPLVKIPIFKLLEKIIDPL